MANFGPLFLTKAGRRVLAQAQTGLPLKFTKAVSGDGVLPSGTQVENLTNVIHFAANLPLNSNEIIGDGTTQIDAIVSNKNLSVGYFFREVGLFAKDNETGQEVLYAYANAGDLPDFIPAANGPHAVNLVLGIITVIDQATNIQISIAEGYGFVRLQAIIDAAKGVRSLIGYDPSAKLIFGVPLSDMLFNFFDRIRVGATVISGGGDGFDSFDTVKVGTAIIGGDGINFSTIKVNAIVIE
jgi:hypothetical protein